MTGPNNSEMHCVVIVVSAVSIMAGMRADVWSDLIDRVENISGYTPMFVITHHFVAGDHGKPLAKRFKSVLGALRIDEDDIFCVENYRRESHSRDDKRHLQFLNILRRMVVNGEKAIHKEHRRPSDQRSRAVHGVPSEQPPRHVLSTPRVLLHQPHYHQNSSRTQKSRTCIII
ncbi:uncharacterized protein LOC105446330 [Strongylocentrotus purpuratus]|uniref:Uncharacterized protein n=1 Tax=Strongylocentrotus purpuratus TaxID=7668 RepID=A0A7M7N689_STRPU|nr:uncharacterized protein LOC105446330 [Strongylocentrotus purpuratus]